MIDHPRVLLIDGDCAEAHACRAAMRSALNPLEADAVCGGLEAIAVLQQPTPGAAELPYEAVAVDLGISKAPLKLLARLAGGLPGVPIIALVAADQADRAQAVLHAGAEEVVLKTPGLAGHLTIILRLVVERNRLAREVEEQRQQVLKLTTHDELTHLSRRDPFHRALESEIERTREFHRPLTLILLNLDGLKLINDTHGYAAGDAALRHVGSCLQADAKRYALAARMGGDEFAVALVDTNYDQGRHVADKLRQQISAAAVEGVGQVTISAGVASVPAHALDATELMRIANQALYEAKRSGRNRVIASRDLRRQRQDERHPVRLKVTVSGRNSRGETFTEETETEMISRRGARIVTSTTVTAGEQIELRTPFHPQPFTAQITSCYITEDGRRHVGFKLLNPPQWTI